MCRKEPSAQVLILAIRFLGGQAPRTENHLFMALFLGNRVELFRELSSANTHQLKVKLWNGPVLYLASLFGNPSVSSSFHLYPRSLPLPLTPLHSHLCPQLTCNQTFSAYWCLHRACLSSDISSFNHQPLLDSGPSVVGSHFQINNNKE